MSERRLPSMASVDRVVGCLVAGFGVLVVLASRALAYQTPFGPGPGFFPTWLGAGLVVLGV